MLVVHRYRGHDDRYWWNGGYWSDGCFGCGTWYCYECGVPVCPVCQWYANAPPWSPSSQYIRENLKPFAYTILHAHCHPILRCKR